MMAVVQTLFNFPWHEQIVKILKISWPLIQGLRITFANARESCSQATFPAREPVCFHGISWPNTFTDFHHLSPFHLGKTNVPLAQAGWPPLPASEVLAASECHQEVQTLCNFEIVTPCHTWTAWDPHGLMQEDSSAAANYPYELTKNCCLTAKHVCPQRPSRPVLTCLDLANPCLTKRSE